MDGVLFCELLGKGNAELVEVCESILDYLRTSRTAEEKGGLGVFGGFWCLLV